MRIILITAVAVLVSTCARQPTALEQVQASGELRVVTRNSPVTYYIGVAGPEGPEYDLVRGFAKRLGVRLALVETDRFGDLLGEVATGRAHMAAAGLTVTADRARRVRFSPHYADVSQVLVYRRGRKAPKGPADLVGRHIEVVAHSSYVDSLAQARRQAPGLAWIEHPSADAGHLLDRVSSGEIDHTVVDSTIFDMYQRFHPELKAAFALAKGDRLAWAFRRDSDRSLIEASAAYIAELRESGDLQRIHDRYYAHKVNKFFDYAGTRRFMEDYQQMLPRYRHLFEHAAGRADLDWRLIAAVGYQESKWNPTAISHMGASGIMMLTADTASLIGVDDPHDPAQSIMGGSRYLWRMQKRIRKLVKAGTSDQDIMWMALAAYNMGYGHLLDARRITAMRGGNPDRWTDLKRDLPLLMEREWYSQMRWGYARSRETLQYVRNVRNYYDILTWLTPGAEDQAPQVHEDGDVRLTLATGSTGVSSQAGSAPRPAPARQPAPEAI